MTEIEDESGTVSAAAVAEIVRALSRGVDLDRTALARGLEHHPELIDSFSDLSSTMTRWKQKDRERSALLESASELIRVRDTEKLLQKLVDRAQTLIGCDIAYLSQYYPETDDLRVQASRGAISANLKELRVPPGVGLAGQVVRDRAAQWTSNYDLTRLPHERRVDSAVKAERMESLLGVPMVVDGEVLGALFAANRYPHDFTTDEITLLSALADHASVVLKTAQLMGDLAEAAQASAEAEETAAAQASTLQRLVEVEEQLTQLVLQGQGVPAVLDAISKLLQADVIVVDSGRLGSPNFPADEEFFDGIAVDNADVHAALSHSRATGRSAQVDGAQHLYVASVASHRRQHSGLFVRFTDEPADGDANIVAQAAQTLALIRMNEQARADAENRVRGELAVDIIAGTRDLSELEARSRTGSFSLSGPWRLMTIQGDIENDDRIAARLVRVEPRILMTQRSPGITVLLPSAVIRDRPTLDTLFEESGALESSLVIISDTDYDRKQLRTAEDEMWSCIRILNSLGISEGIFPTEDFAPYTAMFGTAPEQTERFMQRMLEPLRRWDRTHSAELLSTLREYFESGMSIRRTATQMSVHVNTVKQRLERADLVLGQEWRTPERAFRLQVALRLEKLKSSF
ncbi:helix-turn-helix domain-containing protein [Brevibacterium linens]|uniref:PucR C-terminal helix-turn-helix domain-containing protein n=1 Tax=Brevibacterium linens ATCC 9172 TaxID=1255617 RepID=A0A2H1JBL0_BRELN|nr:GAF domain-containing protein [Brevibacterium linens]KAB1948149.1 GAF domain-containing protein [Brevibacterium linens ATCC 9172]SMX84803.1 PucR C-terminal helix-turn-helix domain-containing protein [Brevibacterium linens ATCC 9172]